MILLNDDEIKIILHGGVEKAVFISTPTRDIAKAQLKKVVEWSMEVCEEHDHGEAVVTRRRCWSCWETLLGEAK